MIEDRVLEVRLELTNALHIFASRKFMRDTIREMITTKYVGKCYKKGRIVNIEEIINYSKPVFVRTRIGGSATVAVKFRARFLMYTQGDFICDATVAELIPPNINGDAFTICKSQHTAINVGGSRLARTAIVGQTVPIMVRVARYPVGRPEITIVGDLIGPIKFNPVILKITIDDFNDLLPADWVDNTIGLDPVRVAFYQDILSPWQDQNNRPPNIHISELAKSGARKVGLGGTVRPDEEKKEGNVVYMGISDRLPYGSGLIEFYKNNPPEGRPVVNQPQSDGMRYIHNAIKSQMEGLVTLVGAYSDEQIADLKPVWDSTRALKQY